MLLRSIKNQYPGINAHLHSLLQVEGGWGDFHARHIVHIADVLKAQLRPLGYTVGIEESVQIRRIDDSVSKPEADILIYDSGVQQPAQSFFASPSAQVMTIGELIAENELSEKPYRAVAIYDMKANRAGRGEPVAWIELLSPSNKGNSDDAEIYRSKRIDLLMSGLVFVELDYLHETPPTFPAIPSYRPPRVQREQSDAHPYRIIVLDSRPGIAEGPAWVNSMDVDQSFPLVKIPLNKGDILEFDFGVPYQKTFEEGFLGDQVDYSQLPPRFDSYRIKDQIRIARRMVAIMDASQKELDLETGLFPIEELTLENALAKIEAWAKKR